MMNKTWIDKQRKNSLCAKQLCERMRQEQRLDLMGIRLPGFWHAKIVRSCLHCSS